MSDAPTITLIALAYNHAKYLPQLFDSIEHNAADLAEVILIDNGSGDDTGALMTRFAQSMAKVPVRVLRNPPRTGVTWAVNVALRSATSECIAVTSGDDFLLPGRFTLQRHAMRDDPGLQFCYANGYVCDEEGVVSDTPVHGPATVELLQSRPGTIAGRLYYPVPTLFTQCALFRRAALLAVGGWDEDLVIDDWPLNLKLFSRFGQGFRYVDAYVAAYRRHDTNASRRRFRQYIGQKRVLQKYATGPHLSKGLFALYAAQSLASLKRSQWRRARTFSLAAWRCRPGLPFFVHWLSREARRRIGAHQIR